jgi:integrase/recombinase XerD
VAEVSADDCRRFLDRWRDAAPSTVALHVSVLAGFFRFLCDEGHLERSPMERIRRPPKKRPEDLDVVAVTKKDVERLFAACEDWQELLCLSVLAYLGPRRRAAARVRWRDVNLLHGTIRFLEKGGKVAVKPIPDQLVAILRAALEHEDVRTAPDDYVIPNRRPSTVQKPERSTKLVWETVRRVAGRAGVQRHVHAIRAAFAVHYLETHPGDLEALQALMGHTRSDTTQVYLRKLNRTKAMERVRDLDWGTPFLPGSGLRSDQERRIRDSNPCYRRIRSTAPCGGNSQSSRLGKSGPNGAARRSGDRKPRRLGGVRRDIPGELRAATFTPGLAGGRHARRGRGNRPHRWLTAGRRYLPCAASFDARQVFDHEGRAVTVGTEPTDEAGMDLPGEAA